MELRRSETPGLYSSDGDIVSNRDFLPKNCAIPRQAGYRFKAVRHLRYTAERDEAICSRAHTPVLSSTTAWGETDRITV